MKKFISSFIPVTRTVVVGIRWKAVLAVIILVAWCAALGVSVTKIDQVAGGACTKIFVPEENHFYLYSIDSANYYNLWASTIFLFGLVMFCLTMAILSPFTNVEASPFGIWIGLSSIILLSMATVALVGVAFVDDAKRFTCILEPLWAKWLFGGFIASIIPHMAGLLLLAGCILYGFGYVLYLLCRVDTWKCIGGFLAELFSSAFLVKKVETVGWVEAPVSLKDVPVRDVERGEDLTSDNISVNTMVN
jgi:hypothetical protein